MQEFGGDFVQKMALTAAVLFVFGMLYNALTAWMERNGYDRGYTAFLVVGGVAVTVVAVHWAIGWQAVLVLLLAFAASGIPMIIGSMMRHKMAEHQEMEEINHAAKEVLHG
jgi:uncharacterized membrane protein YjfL (UPF0719 family)